MVRFIYSKQRLQLEELRRAHISGTKLSVGCLGVNAMLQREKTALKFIRNLKQFTHD